MADESATGSTGGSAPLGTEVVSNGNSGSNANTAPAVANTPTPLDVSDDTLIKIKGSDKPVAFKDYTRGFQSQFTKASQKAAQLEKALAEREQRIQQYEREKAAATQGQQANPANDPLAALEQLPYLSGKDAKAVVQSIGESIKQRDQVLLATLKQLQKVQQVVAQLSNTHTSTNFDGKINKWLTDGGYPLEAADLAKEIYLAYEGDDLDDDFPRIFSERWQQIQKLVETQRMAKVQAARRVPFLPGRGGAAGPTKPLQLNPRNSPREDADALWESIQNSDET